MRGNRTPTTRFDNFHSIILLLLFLAFLRADQQVLDLMQVVVQQLNLIERSPLAVSSNDHESDSMMFGKSFIFSEIELLLQHGLFC